jgi:hypothetical protein
MCLSVIECSICSCHQKKFDEFLLMHLGGPKMTLEIQKLIYTLLSSGRWKPGSAVVSTRMEALHPELWKSFLVSMDGASTDIVRSALIDANTLLIDNLSNCRKINQNGWQSWFLPFVMNYDLEEKADESHFKVSHLAINILNTVHFSLFFDMDCGQLLLSTVDNIRNYGEKNSWKSLSVCRTFLQSLLLRFIKERNYLLRIAETTDNPILINILSVLNTVRTYVFASYKWGKISLRIGSTFNFSLNDEDYGIHLDEDLKCPDFELLASSRDVADKLSSQFIVDQVRDDRKKVIVKSLIAEAEFFREAVIFLTQLEIMDMVLLPENKQLLVRKFISNVSGPNASAARAEVMKELQLE